jgi:hypothetical protein
MKKHFNKKPKQSAPVQTKPRPKVVQELAKQFEADLNRSLPISIQPDGSIVYKNYYIKQIANKNWGLFNLMTKDLIEEFYLKTSALMGAKAYNAIQLEKFFEIKRLDNRYWANFTDSLIYGKNMKTAKDFDKYQVLLTRYEHSAFLSEHFKEEISRMFKWSFV